MSLDDYNYYNDSRNRARRSQWFDSFDEKAMTVEVSYYDEEGDEFSATLPVTFEVCSTCNGRGSHVNPSIDCNGLTSDDFRDDPDFEEEYFSGSYDVSCYECGGRRVSPVIDDIGLDAEQREVVEAIRQNAEDDAEYEAMVAAEIRAGC